MKNNNFKNISWLGIDERAVQRNRFYNFRPGYDPNFLLRPFQALGFTWIENAKCGSRYAKICLASHLNIINLEKILKDNNIKNLELFIQSEIDRFQHIAHHNGTNWDSYFNDNLNKKIICIGRNPLDRFLSCFLMHAYRILTLPITFENEFQKVGIIQTLNFEKFIWYFKNGFPDCYPKWFIESIYGHLYFISDNNLINNIKNITYLDIKDIDRFFLNIGISEKTILNSKKLIKSLNHHRISENKINKYCGDMAINDLLENNNLITKNFNNFYNKETEKEVMDIFSKDISFINNFSFNRV